MNEKTQGIFIEWAKRASHCLGDTYDACKPFLDKSNTSLEPLVRFVSAQLQISCHLTSESIFLLILNCKIWDADILLRSVLEGTFKYVYLLMGSPEEQKRKANEYWNIMPDMARLARHHRATNILKAVDAEDMLMWRPIHELTIDNIEAESLSKKYTRKEKQKLGQKWSFSGISRFFAQHENKKFKNMGILGYDYGIKSHLIHQDGDGVGIIWDRFRRSAERQDSMAVAHAGRIISDICIFGLFRAGELLTACKQNASTTLEIYNRYVDLFEGISEARKDWHGIEYGKPTV